MKTYRISNALLKSHPSPLLSFLAPSIPTSLWSINASKPLSKPENFLCRTRIRNLVTKTPSLQVPANATAHVQEEDSNDVSTRQSQSYQEDEGARHEIDNIINFVPESQFRPQNASTHMASSADQAGPMSSADLIRNRKSSTTNRNSQPPMNEGALAEAMFGVDNYHRGGRPLPPLKPPIRLDAFVGRSEEVDSSRGNDLARKLRLLEIKLSLNRVRADFNAQRFHERAGLKRKRLKSQRWRKRFKEGFKAVVKKVQDMRKRGW
ncbi:hypothetical protein MMC14_002315 [Varicellaria rhodocarpa]|nr:hypothetical protein [Varicellaria rhodocarpa]